MHHTVLVWLSFVGIVLTDAEISIQSTTLAPIFGPLQYNGAPLAYHPFRNQPSPFYPVHGYSDYRAALARNSIRVPVSFNPGSYQQDNYLRSIPVPVSYDPNSQLLANPYQNRNNLYVNSFSNRPGFSGFSTPVPVLVKSPFDFALQSTPRPFKIAHTPEPYYSSTPFRFTTQATPILNSAESLPVIINNGYRKHPKAHIRRLNIPDITRYSTTPVPDIQSSTSLPGVVDNGYQEYANENLNNLIRPDITSYSTIPFPVTTLATPTVNSPASLPVIIDNGFKKHPKAKLNRFIRPDITKYLTTPKTVSITIPATPIDSPVSLPVIINRGYKKHPKTNVDPLIRPDLTTYSSVQLPQSKIEPSASPKYYPIPGAVQFTSNSQKQSQSPKAVRLNFNSLNLAQPSIPEQSPVPPLLPSNLPNQAQPSLPVQLNINSQGETQFPISAQVTSNSQNQALSSIPGQFTPNSLDKSQPARPVLYTSNSQNQAQIPLKVELLSSNSLTQTQQFASNSRTQAESRFPEQLVTNNLNQVQTFRPVQLTSNSLNQAQHYKPKPTESNSQNQGQSPLRTYSLVSPSNGRQVLISNPSLLQNMFQMFKKGSLLTSEAVFPKPDLDDPAEFSLDDSYAKTIAYITSLLRANSEKEPLVYIGTTPAPDISKYLEISTPAATAVSRVNFKAGDTNYNY